MRHVKEIYFTLRILSLGIIEYVNNYNVNNILPCCEMIFTVVLYHKSICHKKKKKQPEATLMQGTAVV